MSLAIHPGTGLNRGQFDSSEMSPQPWICRRRSVRELSVFGGTELTDEGTMAKAHFQTLRGEAAVTAPSQLGLNALIGKGETPNIP